MVFQNDILAGSSGGTGTSSAVHTIGQSIRFNDDDSAYMTRTPSSAGNRRTWTWSAWLKRGNITSTMQLFNSGADDSNNSRFQINSNDVLSYVHADSGSVTDQIKTNMVLRDTSAWYNIQLVADTTNAVETERLRLYVNGQRITDLATTNYPTLNFDTDINNNQAHNIGRLFSGTQYLDGYLAEIHFLDGYAYDPSYFGLFNQNGIWIPKEYSGSYGTNGFHIKGESASDLGNDSSSNNNDFTTSGLASHDFCLDSPTNNFAVFNPVMTNDADFEFSEGNLKLDMNTNKSWYVGAGASMSMTSGKWYWESYWNSGDQYTIWGILDTEQLHALAGSSGSTTIYSLNFNGIQPNTSGTNDQYRQGASVIATGQGGSPGGIWQFALDMDNKKMWLGYNGTWVGSGDPSGGTNETWSSTYIASSSYTPANAGYQISQHSILTYNFGQEGTFAGNITAGNNSDGNGIGNFKYSVPSGYLALCTKNLGS